jgi:hypothetical protein
LFEIKVINSKNIVLLKQKKGKIII